MECMNEFEFGIRNSEESWCSADNALTGDAAEHKSQDKVLDGSDGMFCLLGNKRKEADTVYDGDEIPLGSGLYGTEGAHDDGGAMKSATPNRWQFV